MSAIGALLGAIVLGIVGVVLIVVGMMGMAEPARNPSDRFTWICVFLAGVALLVAGVYR